jgi:RNA polymerase sigma factor (sigma-70 family)
MDVDGWFAANQDDLVRYGFLVCGDLARAEDAVADAMVRSWAKLRRGRVEHPLAYVRRAINRHLIDRARHDDVERRAAPRLVNREAVEPRENDVLDRLVLWPHLLGLPSSQRAVLVLRYFVGLSEAEIAAELDIAPGTVKSRSARALQTLRRAMETTDA